MNQIVANLAVLPMTGGDGPMLVTIAGLSIAGLSVVLLFFMKRKGRNKPKSKATGSYPPR